MLLGRTDEEIIILYKEGNKEIFKELVDKYTSPLFNFTARLTDKNNAPDIIQDVFIKIWKKLDSFDTSKSSFKTWIFTITKNTIIDFWRKNKIPGGEKKIFSFSDLEKNNNDYSFEMSIIDTEALPDAALIKLEDKKILNNLIDKLPENYKTVLILHYQEEMTFSEIGSILDKPLNTIKSHHQRAILKIKEML